MPALQREAHARPFDTLGAPLALSHFALYTAGAGKEVEQAQLVGLCRRLGVAEPAPEDGNCIIETSDFKLRWERHTEFSSYTVLVTDPARLPFAERALDRLPPGWVDGLPGELISALHLALVPGDEDPVSGGNAGRWFDTKSLAASLCAGDAASVWTDFRPDEEGFVRILVVASDLTPNQGGRLIRRLVELETYRMMALLGLPLAREVAPSITGMEEKLGELADHIATVDNPERERDLLGSLLDLSAHVERLMARTNFRFGATQAYGRLMTRRVQALREQRQEGYSTIDEFMARRMAPALDTCVYMQDRLERLSKRLSRTANLLRTRVDVALEEQNRDLLESMNRRTKLQLRLQETVEGLSVVILSYYTVSLIGHAAKGLKAAGLQVPVELVTGASIPVVLLAVGVAIHVVRRRLGSGADE